MTLVKFLVTAGVVGLAVPAAAAVTVIGTSSARLCFEAADARGVPSESDLGYCDQALRGEALSDYEITATYVNRGILKLRRNNVDAAIADFDAAIARDPDEPESYLNKGMAKLRLSDGWDDAVPLFDAAIAKETRRPAIAYYGRAIANELGGHIRQAYLDYRQASQLEPKWDEPQKDLSRFTVRPRG